jgi:hypothetical protein
MQDVFMARKAAQNSHKRMLALGMQLSHSINKTFPSFIRFYAHAHTSHGCAASRCIRQDGDCVTESTVWFVV